MGLEIIFILLVIVLGNYSCNGYRWNERKRISVRVCLGNVPDSTISTSSKKGFGKKEESSSVVNVEKEPLVRETLETYELSNVKPTPPLNSDIAVQPGEDLRAKSDKPSSVPSYFKKRKMELKESILSKKKRLSELQAGARADPSVGAVPELVANRMIKRIAIFFGLPVFGGLGVFAAAYFTYKQFDLAIEPGIIAYATQFPFVVGLLGITYAIISSSWDEEEGSLLGIQEFQTNLQRIRDGAKRNKEVASLEVELEKEETEYRRYR